LGELVGGSAQLAKTTPPTEAGKNSNHISQEKVVNWGQTTATAVLTGWQPLEGGERCER
jgi:hypothetical protein